ncbi:MAG: hypothetical protein LBB23_00045 [Rickettsiales bacterium]|jgi:hypothetical protein|nr:hypothetical protein [Rickettsiales bacterium]
MNFLPYQIEVLNRAREMLGKQFQMNMAVEEMSELTKELCKDMRGKGDINSITDEVADVYIMLKAMELAYNLDGTRIAEIVLGKIDRLSNRLDVREQSGIKPGENSIELDKRADAAFALQQKAR